MNRPFAFGCRRAFTSSILKGMLLLPFAGLFAPEARAQHKTDAPPPGSQRSTKSKILDAGADVLQNKKPIDAMSAYLNGFHFYADDMGRQVEAHHFCTHLTEDFHQCVIFDSNESNAKLIGIEYIVSERVFNSLPDDEKKLWHSHNYEVKSGELIAPRIPDVAEHALMQDLVTTYGKTWHTWQIDRDASFPLGIPQLMMGFTRDGQINTPMVEGRDKRFDVSTAAQRRKRADIPERPVVNGANAWQSGTSVQLTLAEVQVKNLRR
ncbi:OBAP family protein [Paraburkholderia strydomiana]|uniref:OBAP family protein n=1 Tax=Paraburkholderia strydomiana TaxID=1245417 RepID=UPI001BEC6524|nr:OBAP family protein [Paraburkholderia strydomiana]MBT2794436.1 OBAP family protein [Paraburkholderia strydomiana]